jgi:endonuclease/exonuclease/phosphatase family metal-dependent hydrolase
MRSRLRLQYAFFLEAVLIGVFFVQALRFLIGMVYSRIGGLSVVIALDPATIPAGTSGTLNQAIVSSEISFFVYMLALPLLGLIFGRWRWLFIVAAALTAIGRALMLADSTFTPMMGAALAVGGGLLYTVMVIRHRASLLPYMFVLALGIDQVFRAVGNTLDPSWSPRYLQAQIVLSLVTIALSILGYVGERRRHNDQTPVSPDCGLMPFWGGIGFGGLLFLELSLLSLPNALAGRAEVDYTVFAPFVVLATTLPLLPWVRRQARNFITVFDGGVRGWLWMLLIALLVMIGTRFQGIFAGVALLLAAFTGSMLWWWLVRPQAENERNLSGLWLTLGFLLFLLFVAGDNFTYEYAYVRNLAPDFSFLNNSIPPFLRGFRGMGLGLLLLGVFLAVLPMVQTPRRIPWAGGTKGQSLLALLVVAGLAAGVTFAVRPPVIAGVRGVDTLRIGTYNIHSGFNEFYQFDLEAIASTIQQSGANAVLLQQVEAGRLTSFGVDQSLWLARRLGMDTRFYATNEGLQGLAVLSNVEIVYDDGLPLTSIGSQQTGLQRVQIRPDAGVITLYNTWLAFLLESGDGRTIAEQEQDQQRQLNEVFVIISNQHPDGNLGRMVIGGTFNNVPDSPLIAEMRTAGFRDPFAGQPKELTATLWRTGLPHVQLDYLWVRSMLALGALVMDSAPSDHRMAVVEVQITRGQ